MFYGLSENEAPNFEALCFDKSDSCIDKEYFDTYAEARKFAEAEQTKLDYAWVAIAPLNHAAYDEMCRQAPISS